MRVSGLLLCGLSIVWICDNGSFLEKDIDSALGAGCINLHIQPHERRADEWESERLQGEQD